MSKAVPFLSRGMLILGMVLILAGLGWGLWTRLSAPPPPVITEEGAVVLAVTAPSKPTIVAVEPTLLPTTATAIEPPHAEGPTPALLPDWAASPEPPEATPTLPAATILPSASPTPVPAHRPPTRIVASSIKLDAQVIPMGWEMVDHNGNLVSEWSVPKDAAGWHMNSGLPGHGENVVVSGHHNIEGKVFRHVVDLQPGDEISLYVGDTPYLYVVTEKYILKEAGMPLKVRQKNAQWIMPTGDERLTLVSCWPYEWPGNTHRVIVVARPLDDSPEGAGSQQ